ncbi:MAG: hypothetical protein HY905_03480 [Deltaproteobacteria bacterium]|nr:hypothetical protein [Deltaproteobacteria bacterium]
MALGVLACALALACSRRGVGEDAGPGSSRAVRGSPGATPRAIEEPAARKPAPEDGVVATPTPAQPLVPEAADAAATDAGHPADLSGRPLVVAGPDGLATVDRDGSVIREITGTPLALARWLPGNSELVGLGADGRSILRIELESGAVRAVASLPERVRVCASVEHEAGDMAVGAVGSDAGGSLHVESDDAVWVVPGGEVLCLVLQDRNANMMDYAVRFRVVLADGKVEAAIEFPEACAVAAPTGCGPEEKPQPVPRPSSRTTYPFEVDASARLVRDGRVAGVFAPTLDVLEDSFGHRSPSGRWVVLSGGVDGGDYIWRSLWLVDRQEGKVFPVREGTFPEAIEAAAADPQATERVAGESTVRWEDGSPEVLVIDDLLVVPGYAVVRLEGRVAE